MHLVTETVIRQEIVVFCVTSFCTLFVLKSCMLYILKAIRQSKKKEIGERENNHIHMHTNPKVMMKQR